MKTHLIAVIVINLLGCLNIKTKEINKLSSDSTMDRKVDSILIDRKKIQLIENILNLPDVIKFSKLEFIRKKYHSIFIVLKGNEFRGSRPRIIQNGYELGVLHSSDSLHTTGQPCYVFTRLEVKGDTAYVQMILDITGTLVFGKLIYSGDRWVPDREFVIGVR